MTRRRLPPSKGNRLSNVTDVVLPANGRKCASRSVHRPGSAEMAGVDRIDRIRESLRLRETCAFLCRVEQSRRVWDPEREYGFTKRPLPSQMTLQALLRAQSVDRQLKRARFVGRPAQFVVDHAEIAVGEKVDTIGFAVHRRGLGPRRFRRRIRRSGDARAGERRPEHSRPPSEPASPRPAAAGDPSSPGARARPPCRQSCEKLFDDFSKRPRGVDRVRRDCLVPFVLPASEERLNTSHELPLRADPSPLRRRALPPDGHVLCRTKDSEISLECADRPSSEDWASGREMHRVTTTAARIGSTQARDPVFRVPPRKRSGVDPFSSIARPAASLAGSLRRRWAHQRFVVKADGRNPRVVGGPKAARRNRASAAPRRSFSSASQG